MPHAGVGELEAPSAAEPALDVAAEAEGGATPGPPPRTYFVVSGSGLCGATTQVHIGADPRVGWEGICGSVDAHTKMLQDFRCGRIAQPCPFLICFAQQYTTSRLSAWPLNVYSLGACLRPVERACAVVEMQ